MALEFRKGGRKVSQRAFLDGLGDDIIERAMDAYAEELHGKASSVVDPETGKHVPVIVRCIGQQSWTILTSGSPTIARALEERLGLSFGEVHLMNEPVVRERLVYLAHATEDKEIVRPLAEGLMSRGIKVWYDNWEITPGDSLRRKMEEGLGNCTHFVVLLTETSIKKPWVNEEIDVGLLRVVDGAAKFIGLRLGISVADLSPFMQTRLVPDLRPGDVGLDDLAGVIFGVSKKPPLGDKPRYVQEHKPGSTWSTSARAVAEFFVRRTEHAQSMDPISSYVEIQEATGLPMVDVRIGALDLIGAGLVKRQDFVGADTNIWAEEGLFYTFDDEFMDWKPVKDAADLAVYLLNLGEEYAVASDVASSLGWDARRFNPAVAYLVAARVIDPTRETYNGQYSHGAFTLGDQLLRFVRSL